MTWVALPGNYAWLIQALADFNAAALSSSRRYRIGRSLWKVLTFVGPQLCRAFGPALFYR
jgi:hypothetical protein